MDVIKTFRDLKYTLKGVDCNPTFPFYKRDSHFESNLQILYSKFHFCNIFPVPYVGSEHTWGLKGYNYNLFQQKVAECLQNAGYPFLYYCRSTPPKSDTTFTREQGELIMKMKLAQHFMDKGFYFKKVHLTEDTELMISNQLYDEVAQFQWTTFDDDIT